ncbi:MAG TPA: hypothetical protein VFV38_13945 [Ktedonobacteraceae bacterium]|nr:hypothetical protein [Ktedonobacteraceae bacterium]
MQQTQQIERTDQQPAIPALPPWPTSKPGPQVTDPPPGQRRVPGRTEQVMEIGYDETQGRSTIRNREK